MDFKGYNSILNPTEYIVRSVIDNHGDDTWCAREKIHGTNYSMLTDGTTFVTATRKQMILPTTKFYNHANIDAKYKQNIIDLFNHMKSNGTIGDEQCLVVFGEYAGTAPSGRSVQTGIDYGEEDFYVFDIGVRNIIIPAQDESEDDSDYEISHIDFVDDDVMQQLCDNFGLNTAPLLMVGKPVDIFKIPFDLQSVVVDYNNKKPINIVTGTDNMAEGFVCKPVKSVRLKNGRRVIFKCKNDKWKEKTHKQRIVVDEMSESDQSVVDELRNYLTDNRLRNVLSKHGVPKSNEFNVISNALVIDALSDYANEHGEIDPLSVDDYSRIISVINHDAGNLIRPNWVAIFKGEF